MVANMEPFQNQHQGTIPRKRFLQLFILGLTLACSASARKPTKRELDVSKFINKGKASRFSQPWPRLQAKSFPTLEQSRHRVLFSSLRRQGGDGLGHGFATKNIEVFTARLLGISYMHRRPLFQSITQNNENLMEDFFGWGKNELERDKFQAKHCQSDPPKLPSECAHCGKAKGQYKIVHVPKEFSLTNPNSNPKALAKVSKFLGKHNDSYTIFHMDSSNCDSSPFFSTFNQTGEWFRYKFWNRHYERTGFIENQALQLYGRWEPNLLETVNGSRSADVRDAPLKFKDDELSIAVHVRRGDFFEDKKRVSLKSAVYAQVIRTVQDVVEEGGGPFASLPVAVYIYSEGRPKETHQATKKPLYGTHDISRLSKDYVDENGIVRDQKWWTILIKSLRPQEKDRPKSRLRKNVKVPRVELRVSQSTVQTLHQMIRADVFIGSVSGLSSYLVRNLGRGVGVYPSQHASDHPCCIVNSDVDYGIIDRKRFAEYWNMYRKGNERYLK